MTEPNEAHVRTGGLMRCCTATLESLREDTITREGAVVRCTVCGTPMIFRADAWEWYQEGED